MKIDLTTQGLQSHEPVKSGRSSPREARPADAKVEHYRSLAMGIILTGMGADGALGMKAIKAAGGYTVGQDEASCAVYGMPRSCAEAGVLGKVVPLMQVPDEIAQALGCPRL
jgi:chemotaxis response regulator CheB